MPANTTKGRTLVTVEQLRWMMLFAHASSSAGLTNKPAFCEAL
jgi:hypothetical protein